MHIVIYLFINLLTGFVAIWQVLSFQLHDHRIITDNGVYVVITFRTLDISVQTVLRLYEYRFADRAAPVIH